MKVLEDTKVIAEGTSMLCVNTNNGLTNEGNANVYMSKLNRHYNIESLSCMIQHPVHE